MVYLALTAKERLRCKRRKRALALRALEERILTIFGGSDGDVLLTASECAFLTGVNGWDRLLIQTWLLILERKAGRDWMGEHFNDAVAPRKGDYSTGANNVNRYFAPFNCCN